VSGEGRIEGRVSADGSRYELVQYGTVRDATPIAEARADDRLKRAILQEQLGAAAMTTSGSTDFGLVTNTIIEEAFDVCGVGSEGEAISADQYERARRSLNLMVKAWSAEEHLWLRTEASVTLVASQASYALATLFSQKPMRVLSVRRRVTSGSLDTPLLELSRQDYDAISSKTVAAVPTSFYFDPQRATGTLYVWPTASTATAAAQTLLVTYLRRIEDFDGSNNDPDLPQEWLEAVTSGSPTGWRSSTSATRACATTSACAPPMARAAIESWDTEPGSVFLQPDWQG
jgi:hypothetical protein